METVKQLVRFCNWGCTFPHEYCCINLTFFRQSCSYLSKSTLIELCSSLMMNHIRKPEDKFKPIFSWDDPKKWNQVFHIWLVFIDFPKERFCKSMLGLNRDLNPGPPAPEAGIIPLDHWATLICFLQEFWMEIHLQIIPLEPTDNCPLTTDQQTIWATLSIWDGCSILTPMKICSTNAIVRPVKSTPKSSYILLLWWLTWCFGWRTCCNTYSYVY